MALLAKVLLPDYSMTKEGPTHSMTVVTATVAGRE
jgi:hypothetical protein